MASEVGAVHIDPENVHYKGRLQPGKMFLVDTQEGRIIDDKELKAEICRKKPYAKWIKENVLKLSDLPKPQQILSTDLGTLLLRQKLFGYSSEDINLLLTPMMENGVEAAGSMGNDTPLAVLSDNPRLLYDYFKQIFAQVSNPPVDAIREELVMSLTSRLGHEKNILDPGPEHARMLKLEHPILNNEQLEKIKELNKQDFKSSTLSMLFDTEKGLDGFVNALQKLCQNAEDEVDAGSVLLVLSDRGVSKNTAPIPALLAVGAVHHYLIRKRKRYRTCLLYTSPSPRD